MQRLCGVGLGGGRLLGTGLRLLLDFGARASGGLGLRLEALALDVRAARRLALLDGGARGGERLGLQRRALLGERERARPGLGLLALRALAQLRLLERLGLRLDALAKRFLFLARLADAALDLARRRALGFGARSLRLRGEHLGRRELGGFLAQRALGFLALASFQGCGIVGRGTIFRRRELVGFERLALASFVGGPCFGGRARFRRSFGFALLLRAQPRFARRALFGLGELARDFRSAVLGFHALGGGGGERALGLLALARELERLR